MTTPGRTHIAWQTDTDHIRELISYIGFLEAKLSYLQYHHESCDIWLSSPPIVDASLSYLPPDIIATGYEANDEATDKSRIPEAMSSLAATSYLSRTNTRPSVKTSKSNPRWKQIIDQITKGWDEPSTWLEKREAIGLDSINQNQYALTAVLGQQHDAPFHLTADESPLFASQASINTTDALVTIAQRYALDSKAFYRNSTLDNQLYVFRELVFASLCVVMEHQGLPIDTIDSLMRLCISSSGSANLYRLRRGALWVNRVISGAMMNKLGWGHGSTEFFLICRNPSCNA